MASTTFTYTAGQGNRMAAAFGKELGLPGDASAAQIKAEIWNFVRAVVNRQEKDAAVSAAIVTAEAGLTDLGSVT